MKRGTFLKRVGLVLGGVAVGRHIPLETPTPPALSYEAEILADSPIAYWPMGENLIASGGLCAPLSPIYDMPSFASSVRDALPMFTASRGVPSPD